MKEDSLRGKRCVIAGLISAKEDAPLLITRAAAVIVSAGGTVVDAIVQRRGVSRSRHPGGAKQLQMPLSSRTAMSSGKVAELATVCHDHAAEVIVYLGAIKPNQIKNLSQLTGCTVCIWENVDGVNDSR
jgi:50S ribosomal subunit-associated GTPase HflX